MSQRSIQLVVLDMAGTTIRDDDAVNRCLREALLHGGVAITREAANAVMGMPKPVAIRMLLEAQRGSGTVSDKEVAHLHDEFLRRMGNFYRTDPSVEPVEGAVQVLAELRDAGLMVALDTGFSRDIADIVLGRLGWMDSRLVNVTVTSDEVPRGRPYPDLIYRAMELTGVSRADYVGKVGDTPADLQEGSAAGCSVVVGVTSGTHTRQQLSGFPHTHLIKSLRELPALLW